MINDMTAELATLFDDTIGLSDDDFIMGDAARDRIWGLAGDDTLIGSTNMDQIFGGEGDDFIIGGGYAIPNIELLLTEDMQNDAVHIERPHPSSNAETLSGGAGNDTIIGGNYQDHDEDGQVDYNELGLGDLSLENQDGFHNIIWGGAGDDQLHGANGFDTLGGGEGDDKLYGHGGVDVIYGGTGNDMIFGGDGDPEFFHRLQGGSEFTLYEQLFGGAGDDQIWGQGGQDRLFGGAGSDLLYGGSESDTLHGGAGQDNLLGGEGDDVLFGDEGADSFWFHFDDSTDVIMDFDPEEDRIVLDYENDELLVSAVDNAIETTMDGLSGLLVETGGGSLFLVGLGESDIPTINVVNLYLDD